MRIRAPRNLVFSTSLVLAAVGATPAFGESWKVTEGVSLRGTYTDNVRLSRAGAEENAFIYELTPSLGVHGRSSRLNIDADLGVHTYAYSGVNAPVRNSPTLGLRSSAQLIENFLFLDTDARIQQQSGSIIGQQSVDPSLLSASNVETRTLSIAPYIRGRIGNDVNYSLRYGVNRTNSDSKSAPGSTITLGSFHLGGGVGNTPFKWAFDTRQSTTQYSAGTHVDTDARSSIFSLSYAIQTNLIVTVRGGKDFNGVLAAQDNSQHRAYGMQVDWALNPQARVSASRDKKSFGDSFSYQFQYRNAISAFQISLAQSLNTLAGNLLTNPVGALALVANTDRFESVPADDRLNQALQYLTSLGMVTQVAPGVYDFGLLSKVVTQQSYVDRRLAASYAWTRGRDTVMVSAYRSRQTGVSSLFFTGVPDDLSTAGGVVLSRGASLSVLHKLTPLSSLAFTTNMSKGSSVTSGAANSLQRRYDLTLNTRLGQHTTGSVGVRHVTLDGSGGTTSYAENALTGVLGLNF